MSTISLSELETSLAEVVHGLMPGKEVVITEGNRPIARLLPAEPVADLQPRTPGTLKGTVLYMAPDFNEPLDDFKEYME